MFGKTGGEATVPQQTGARFVVGDVIEIALEISKMGVNHFNLLETWYCVLNVHCLSFLDSTFDAVTVTNALHRFPNCALALRESNRVLKPEGQSISIEPNGLSPLRRLSEIRDRLRGTIEKCFYKGQLIRLSLALGRWEKLFSGSSWNTNVDGKLPQTTIDFNHLLSEVIT